MKIGAFCTNHGHRYLLQRRNAEGVRVGREYGLTYELFDTFAGEGVASGVINLQKKFYITQGGKKSSGPSVVLGQLKQKKVVGREKDVGHLCGTHSTHSLD